MTLPLKKSQETNFGRNKMPQRKKNTTKCVMTVMCWDAAPFSKVLTFKQLFTSAVLRSNLSASSLIIFPLRVGIWFPFSWIWSGLWMKRMRQRWHWVISDSSSQRAFISLSLSLSVSLCLSVSPSLPECLLLETGHHSLREPRPVWSGRGQ